MYNPYQMYAPQPQQQMQTNNQNNQIGNNGYVIVRSEEEARNYPLAPGFSMTFFNETQPYCYKKTMSYSPLDHPTFEVYKIVKEESKPEEQVVVEEKEPLWKADIIALQNEINVIREELQILKSKPKQSPRKKEDAKDDTE